MPQNCMKSLKLYFSKYDVLNEGGSFVKKNIYLSVVAFLCSVVFIGALAKADTLSSLKGQKPVLLISDIDDTIKVSHILSSLKFLRAADSETPFAGMAPLYQLISYDYGVRLKIVYLSNAPKDILGYEPMKIAHEKLLKLNKFPTGELLLRESLLDQHHKINAIRKLVMQNNPELVIMIGDNGEKDIEIYAEAAQELTNLGIRSETYIHQLYSKLARWEVGKLPEATQTGFVTPVEIAIDLNAKKLVSEHTLDWMLTKVGPYIYQESIFKFDALSPITFPLFKDCSDFKWKWPVNSKNYAHHQFLIDKCN